MKKLILLFILAVFGCTSLSKEKKMNEWPDFDSKWNYSDPSATRETFEKIQRETEKSANLNYRLELVTQIARTYSLQANFAAAHELLDSVDNALTSETQVARVRFYLERGRTFNSANEKERARRNFISAFELAKEIDAENYEIDAAHMMAIAVGDSAEKLMWNEKGLEVARSAKDEKSRRWIGTFLNNIGWDFFEEKKYEKALDYFSQCEQHYRDSDNKERHRIARWSVAKTQRLLGKTEQALKVQLNLLQEVGGVDKSGYTYEELGELYLVLNDKPNSTLYFAKAHEVLSKDIWLQKNETERLKRIEQLSK